MFFLPMDLSPMLRFANLVHLAAFSHTRYLQAYLHLSFYYFLCVLYYDDMSCHGCCLVKENGTCHCISTSTKNQEIKLIYLNVLLGTGIFMFCQSKFVVYLRELCMCICLIVRYLDVFFVEKSVYLLFVMCFKTSFVQLESIQICSVLYPFP